MSFFSFLIPAILPSLFYLIILAMALSTLLVFQIEKFILFRNSLVYVCFLFH